MTPSGWGRTWSRGRLLSGAAGVLVLVLVAVGAWRTTSRTPPPPSATAAPAAPTAVGSRPGSGEAAPVAVPTVTQADLRWADVAGVRVPVSATAGPRLSTSAGLASGFADSPLGALLAAVHIMLRLNAALGPRVYRPTLDRQVVGPDKTAALVMLDQQYQQARADAGVPDGQPVGRLSVTVAGYRFVGYSDDWAVVHLLLRSPGTSSGVVYGDNRVDLRWQDADWRVVAPPGGDWESTTTLVSAPTGYVGLGG